MINIKKKLHPTLLEIFKKNKLSHYRIIIKFKTLSKKLERLFNNSKHCNIIHILNQLNIICLITSHKFLSSLIEHPEIEYLCLDSELILCGNKSPINKDNKEFQDIKTISYDTTLTGKNITVALIDSGIYPLEIFKKPKNRILFFKDLINNYSYPYDDNGHGTAMSYIIGSPFIYKNNVLKSASGCDLFIIKAFNKFNQSYCSIIFKALEIIIENLSKINIQLLCLPFELHEFNEFILNIFQFFFNKLSNNNILTILPVGNNLSNYSSLKGLSLLNNCITIGGLNLNESSYGSYSPKSLKPTLLSIFENIYIPTIDHKYIPEKNNEYIYPTKFKNSYTEYYGTSFSCAHICGILTMLKQKNISLSINDVISLFKLCSTKLENINDCLQGLGTININQLLE